MGDRRRVNFGKLCARIGAVSLVVGAGVLLTKKIIDPLAAMALAGFGTGLWGTTTRETFRRPERLPLTDEDITKVERRP